MANRKLTDKQREILEYLKECILQKGYPPAVREICEAVHLKSTSSVHAHLESLEEKGYIRKDPTKPRAIEILDDEFNLARREVINVPIVGTVANQFLQSRTFRATFQSHRNICMQMARIHSC